MFELLSEVENKRNKEFWESLTSHSAYLLGLANYIQKSKGVNKLSQQRLHGA